jgi:glycosyltransferase involved in cell wall biosynthesis
MPKVLVLIPSFNEKSSIIKILKKIKHDVLVLDDFSSDGTLKLIKSIKKDKLKIISNKKNHGYEKNLLNGFKKIIKKNFEYVITFDADGEHDTRDIMRIEKYLIKNDVDMLIGVRSKKNRLEEKVVSFFFKLFFSVEDPLSGFKAYKIKKLKKIINEIKYNYFLVDIIRIFKKRNYRIDTLNINSKKLKKRIPRIGNNFFVRLKILKCIGLLI